MSTFRNLAKHAAFFLLGSEPALRLRIKKIQNANVVTVLNLHRVHDFDGSDYRPLDPKIFDQLLSYLSSHFSFVTFENLSEATNKPKIILSFDDGYRDFIEVAAPLLQKHGIRVNQNVIPACIEQQLPPLNVLAADFIGKAPLELVKALQIPGFGPAEPRRPSAHLSNFLKNRPFNEQVCNAKPLRG
jgi:hypothetical protein